MNDFSRRFVCISAVTTALIGQGALAQDAVQWSKADGGNGHWYKGVPDYLNWQSAQDSAVAAGGHLATATSDAENMFIMDVRDTQVKFGGAWIGLRQDPDGAEPGEGWMWVTGEPLDYTNWRFNEPNNTDNEGNDSDYVEMCCDSPDWGDWGGGRFLPSIIEWSADCNSDGIVDYGQILDGSLVDDDGNGIPDLCNWDIVVPDDHVTIQAAIDAAADGDRILVRAGEYPEAINFGAKNLVLESEDGPEATIIGRYGTKISIVTIGGGQTMATELRGFTIWRGYRGTPVPGNPSSLVGGGIFVNDSSPLIEDCIFTDNKTAFGSGIYHFYGGGEVRNCQFIDNYATSNGGGAQTFISDVQYINCLFDDNFSVGEGGGIKIVLGTTDLVNCTFTMNGSSGDGGAVFWFANDSSDPMDIIGCTITNNSVASDARGAGVYARPGYAPARLTDSVVCDNQPDEIYGPYEDVSGNTICICLGDINGDDEVGGADLGVMLALWGECQTDPCPPDLNGDGFVNGGDLGLLLSFWGPCPEKPQP